LANKPCKHCGSSDAVEEYPNGSYCFSCKTKEKTLTDTTKWTEQVLSYRSHSLQALNKYKVKLLVDPEGTPKEVLYPYTSFIKHRNLEEKQFYATGENTKAAELFGEEVFPAGSAAAITITEGEEDALSVYDIFGCKWPAVSVRSSSTARKDCAARYNYINSFDKIYLSFDNDEAGEQALRDVAPLFPFNKVHIVRLSNYKDANEMHMAGKEEEYRRIWYNARRFVPENIISSISEFAEVLEEKDKETIASFPFTDLQRMLRGIRLGETVLFKAPEGVGKTEIMGAIEYHVLKTTDINIGVIHLEEPVKRSLQRFANYELGYPVHFDKLTSNETILETIRRVTTRDNRVHFYKNFNSDDINGVLNNIRFLVSSCDCKLIFLDHISRLVSGTMEPDERKALDYISTKLSQQAEELDYGLLMVSHVNDDGQTRGSRNISKEAYAVVNLSRDITNPDETVKNTTYLTLEKNRFGSLTGPAGELYFDISTFMLSEDFPPGNPLPEE